MAIDVNTLTPVEAAFVKDAEEVAKNLKANVRIRVPALEAQLYCSKDIQPLFPAWKIWKLPFKILFVCFVLPVVLAGAAAVFFTFEGEGDSAAKIEKLVSASDNSEEVTSPAAQMVKHPSDMRTPTSHQFKAVYVWESAGLLSLALISVVVYSKQVSRLWRLAKAEEGHVRLAVVLGLILLAMVIFLVGAILFFGTYVFSPQPAPGRYLCYLLCLLAAAIAFCVFDSSVARLSPEHEETTAATMSFCFASAPVFLGIFLLLLYYFICYGWRKMGHASLPPFDFMGGALAFQMIVSNTIFMVINDDFYRRRLLTFSENTHS